MKNFVKAVSLILIFFVFTYQVQSQETKPVAELKELEVFVGEWTYEGETKENPISPAGKFSGKLSIKWILNGFFQEWKSAEKGVFGNLQTIELNWFDAAKKMYYYQGFQNNGDMYSGSLTPNGNVWKWSNILIHDGIEYKVRGEMIIAKDKLSWIGKAEISRDNVNWALLNETKHTKVTPSK